MSSSIKKKDLILNEIVIESRVEDNFINATQLCKAGGKLFKDWYRLDSTKELIKELIQNLDCEGRFLLSQNIKLIDIKRGNSKKFSQGSWVHPDLAVQLAQWISPKFAIQVSRWIRELIITGSVAIDTKKTDEELLKLQEELKTKDNLIKDKDNIIKEKDDRLNRLHIIQKELLSYKKRVSKEETVYIVSTADYARQGIYKIGRTKSAMKFRSSTHNITHIQGDKIKVIREFKVNDSTLVEKNIHTKLQGLLLEGGREFFMCPYDLLESIVDLIVHNDDEENVVVNKIIESVFKLKETSFNSIDWMTGIPPDTFKETFLISQGEEKLAELDISKWSDIDKKEFIAKCIVEYDIKDKEIRWKAFQVFLLEKLTIPKSKFKVANWKPIVKEGAEKEKLAIKWRG